LTDDSPDQALIFGDTERGFDLRGVFFADGPNRRRVAAFDLREVKQIAVVALPVYKADRFAAVFDPVTRRRPLLRGCDESGLGPLREKLQRYSCVMLEYASLKLEKCGVNRCAFGHFFQLCRSCCAEGFYVGLIVAAHMAILSLFYTI
jgi:hypothetical protein